jgi:hypothetical protein
VKVCCCWAGIGVSICVTVAVKEGSSEQLEIIDGREMGKLTSELPEEAMTLQEPCESVIPFAGNCVSSKTTLRER